MKLGFLELMDTSGLSEENKKFFEALDDKIETALESKVKGFLMDEVKLDELRELIKDAADSIKEIKGKEFSGIDKKTFDEKVNELESAILRVKASTEVGGNGEIKVKSVYDQLYEQLKGYITTDKKGGSTLNSKRHVRLLLVINWRSILCWIKKELPQLLHPALWLLTMGLKLTRIYLSIPERRQS